MRVQVPPRAQQTKPQCDGKLVWSIKAPINGIKQASGKLAKAATSGGISAALQSQGFVPLAITADHADHAPTLPKHHKDPFDRMLIAQAQLEDLVLVTADRTLGVYEVGIVDAQL